MVETRPEDDGKRNLGQAVLSMRRLAPDEGHVLGRHNMATGTMRDMPSLDGPSCMRRSLMVACHFKLGSECDTEFGWWVVTATLRPRPSLYAEPP